MKTGRPVSSAAITSPSRMALSMLSAAATWPARTSNLDMTLLLREIRRLRRCSM
jgi:hypothetical protein